MVRLHQLPSGQPLSEGQLRQLQWIVPRSWAAELSATLTRLPIAGAGVRVSISGEEHWLGFFDGERMVEEALRPAAYPLSIARGLLPLAGCGRRGTALYLVEVGSRELPMWQLNVGQAPRCLDVGLDALWQAAQPEPRVTLRRRLPEKTPRRLAKTSASALRPSAALTAACKRTLPLFA